MKLNVLVACEESQAVCKEFRRLGHNAFSCDIQDCSGGHPEWHIKDDCLKIANLEEKMIFPGDSVVPVFYTADRERHILPRHKWDLIIAHPPCTYLANSGSRWLDEDRFGESAVIRQEERRKAIEFFLKIAEVDCGHIAIENPIGCMDKFYRKRDQVIQPWMFGDPHRKSTCLWLKDLPVLIPDVEVEPEIDLVEIECKFGKKKRVDRLFSDTRKLPAEERRKVRSKTFPGIAKAIAEQWAPYVEDCISKKSDKKGLIIMNASEQIGVIDGSVIMSEDTNLDLYSIVGKSVEEAISCLSFVGAVKSKKDEMFDDDGTSIRSIRMYIDSSNVVDIKISYDTRERYVICVCVE